ncbi:hypothetical protein TNIN_128271 [Trichonephila inaurata madagascariensis]|uniref:Uncharacterized protein n=1 Tax=Trichonephila inaurata madagascariensis TaxID=2747483 RepID=A0A8X6Y0Y3_9ARAC|nr:hypothetical protein TNIN_128271 [Trichonephila inaurata madagascariensis]
MVGDRADHPEADSERDTRPGGAGSKSQTGETPTLWPSFGFIEVRLDDGVTFPAGWCVNRVWVPWMSTSSPQYRLGGGENVICQSAHLGIRAQGAHHSSQIVTGDVIVFCS